MSSKTPVSKASTYQDIGVFWDKHDVTEFGEQSGVEFDVNIKVINADPPITYVVLAQCLLSTQSSIQSPSG